MKQIVLFLAICLISSCGDALSGGLVVAPEGEEAHEEPFVEATVPGVTDEPESSLNPTEVVAEDVQIGEPIESDDPGTAEDGCIEADDCPDAAPDGSAVDPSMDPASTGEYMPGEKLITLKYAPLRKSPSKDAATAAVHTGGGTHSDGHPTGTIPPGQQVVVLDAPRTDGYYNVEYKGVSGWVHRNKLEPWDHAIHPVKFASQATVRNAFFMHQIRRSAWNKDGPSSSGNCAPTSLAMAAKIFGKGTPGKTIEQSIHESRNSYGASSNENDGTMRAEIVRGANRLGLDVHELDTSLSTDAELDRIDRQLGLNRAIVLEGQPGSAYRSRMTEAFRAAGSTRSYTFAGTHSILVVSKLDSGKYLIADPISEAGMVTMSRSQLKSFISAWGGTGTAVYDRDWNK